MRLLVMILAAAGLLVGCSARTAQPDRTSNGRTPHPPAYLAGTTSRVIESSRTGRTYQVSVALPRGYEESSRSYPVLYSLDANGEFGLVVETARLLQVEGLVPELVIVGIGYPVGHYFDAIAMRAYDLTVVEDPAWTYPPGAAPGLPPLEGTGGAPQFLGFLRDELIPRIEAEYRVESQDRALLGHSFGGLFTFYALLHGQGAFHRFVVSSPALWWANRVSFQQEAAYAASNTALSAVAFFSAGQLEPSEDLSWGGYVRDLRDLAAVLGRRSYEGMEWTVHFFEEETHMSVLPPAVSRGLRYVYGTR